MNKKQNKLAAIIIMLMRKNYISIIDVIEYMQIIQGEKLYHVLPQLKTKLRKELVSINVDELSLKLRPLINEIQSKKYQGKRLKEGLEYRFTRNGLYIYSDYFYA